MGALAFELRCPERAELRRALGRELSDIDFAALSNQWDPIVEMFEDLGYTFDERWAMLHGHERLIFLLQPDGLRVDVFFDQLAMCHVIDLRDRLLLDELTIPLADLLLEKLQIVRLTEKDIVDTIVLLLEHPIGGDEAVINADYIARLLAGDWGFYHTATINLLRIRDHFLDTYSPPLTAEECAQVREQIGRLLERIEAEPKTLKWRGRARLGTAIKWYRDVGDMTR
jgi:hypothetical protein